MGSAEYLGVSRNATTQTVMLPPSPATASEEHCRVVFPNGMACGHSRSCACHAVESGGDPNMEIAVLRFERHRFVSENQPSLEAFEEEASSQ